MAQSSANAPSTLQGLFKAVYNKQVVQAIPESAIIQRLVPFAKAQLLGDKFHIPVVLSDEAGFTYGGDTAQNYTLNGPVSMQMQDAQVSGYELTLQSGITYGAVSRAESKGSQAVESAVSLLIERMKASCAKRLEIALLYGQSQGGLGVISATSGSGTTRTYTILASQWAAGIWAGMENSNLDCYYNTASGGTQLNTNAVIIITSVNAATQQITVSGNATDLTAIDAQVGSTVGTSATFYFYGAFGNEMAGLQTILGNVSSTMFNISASTYNLWAGNVVDCGAAQLTMSKVLSGISVAVGRGLMESVTLLVSTGSYSNLIADLAAQRRFDGSYKSKKAENGFEAIEFHGQNGTIEVVSHPMLKSGDALCFVPELLHRVGSTDVSFRGQMEGGEQQYIFNSATNNSWICRAYTDQSVVYELPAQSVYFKNIVPTT